MPVVNRGWHWLKDTARCVVFQRIVGDRRHQDPVITALQVKPFFEIPVVNLVVVVHAEICSRMKAGIGWEVEGVVVIHHQGTTVYQELTK